METLLVVVHGNFVSVVVIYCLLGLLAIGALHRHAGRLPNDPSAWLVIPSAVICWPALVVLHGWSVFYSAVTSRIDPERVITYIFGKGK